MTMLMDKQYVGYSMEYRFINLANDVGYNFDTLKNVDYNNLFDWCCNDATLEKMTLLLVYKLWINVNNLTGSTYTLDDMDELTSSTIIELTHEIRESKYNNEIITLLRQSI